MTAKRTVYAIGIDGATFNVIEPMLNAGRLPNMARVMREGAAAPLMSSVPPLSPVAWTSISTGAVPAHHGIVDFTVYNKDKRRSLIYDTSFRRVKPIWRVIDEQGKRSCVINMPFTNPVDEINGLMVSGLGTPPTLEGFAHPRAEFNALDEACGGYQIDIVVAHKEHTPDYLIGQMRKVMETRKKALVHLLERGPWDLFFFVFTNTDRAQHFFWKYHDPSHPDYDAAEAAKYGSFIEDTYAEIDDALGMVLEKMGPDDVLMIMSDHGFGPLKKCFSLSRWLYDSGLVALRPEMQRRKTSALKMTLKKLLPPGVIDFISRKVLRRERGFSEVVAEIDILLDWERTKVFSHKKVDCMFLYFNDAVVGADGREPLIKELKGALEGLKDPASGDVIITDVLDGHEYFEGSGPEVPDVLVLSNPQYDLTFEINDIENMPLISPAESWSGTHEPMGVFMMKGPGVKQGFLFEGPSVADIAPTIYYLLDVAVPANVDGRVLEECFTPEALGKSDIKHSGESADVDTSGAGTLSDEDQEALTKRLKDLGYL